MAETCPIVVNIDSTPVQVNVEQSPIIMQYTGLPGADGPQGPPGRDGGEGFIGVAGMALSGNRFVTSNSLGQIIYSTDAKTYGMTTGSAEYLADVTILASGVIVEPSWSWTPGLPLYLQPSGFISHTPYSAYATEVAKAIMPTQISISIKSVIITEE